MHCRIRLQIRRMLEVLCLLYHCLHRLIFMIQTQQKSGRSLSKLGRIYSIVMKLHQEREAVQVATLLSVVGAEVRKVFAMFTDWASDTYQNKIQPVLQKFAVYYQPLKNVPFERYKFYSRMQESGDS